MAAKQGQRRRCLRGAQPLEAQGVAHRSASFIRRLSSGGCREHEASEIQVLVEEGSEVLAKNCSSCSSFFVARRDVALEDGCVDVATCHVVGGALENKPEHDGVVYEH